MKNFHLNFDKNGRLSPIGLTGKANAISRGYFQPNIEVPDLKQIYRNTHTHLGSLDDLSQVAFESKIAEMLDKLQKDDTLTQMHQCRPMPFILPKHSLSLDLPKAMNRFIIGLTNAYKESFPRNDLIDHSIDEWKALLCINPASRMQRIVDRNQTETVVGLFCPVLSEYSIAASYEAIDAFDMNFSLSGFFEMAAVLIGSPAYLRNTSSYSPLLWASANINHDKNSGFHFAGYGNDLTLNFAAHRNQVSEYWWSGVSMISVP